MLLLLFITIDSLDAQRRRSRRTNQDTEEKLSFADRINYEIRLGSIAFGSGFSIGTKPSVGYKLNDLITLGGHFRIDYEFVNNFNFQDISLFSYGPGLMARGKFMKSYYLQAEYTFFNFENINETRFNRSFPALGVGWVQGGDNWKFNVELMLLLDDITRDYYNRTVDFWFSFSKNF